MVEQYRTESVLHVQRILETSGPNSQVLKICEVTNDKYRCPDDFNALPKLPNHVSNGTRIYERWLDGRIWEICVLRG
jgi:hypothetical protein